MKTKHFFYIAVTFFLSTSFVSAQIKTTNYKVDINKSHVKWIGSKPGGQHHGTVQISEGNIGLENGILKNGTFSVDLKTIKDLDLEDETWNNKLVDHLKSEDFFHVEKYPEATFKLTKASKTANSNFTLTGDLTIKGITIPITFNATINHENGVIKAVSDEIVLDRVKWNIKTMSKSVFSDLKDKYIDDEIRIVVELEAERKK